ncbi:hypothetical protein LTR09_000168 [Extremus antarcticus]|uniref:C2H2-type domain-containing protein n=1 Tax=Extremus antarcticus TaxID=702011 RepID=A0AAJ0LXA4_9PEZI|nr:hypothetical protein LTR09_000168 [Extremus antarcticus]
MAVDRHDGEGFAISVVATEPELTDLAPNTFKRKRASRRGQPPRFHCNEDGCDKTYTRAEHLARHQLNHTPKEVYHCQVQSCESSFVRFDLFERHKARHAADSHASRKDQSLPSGSPIACSSSGERGLACAPVNATLTTSNTELQVITPAGNPPLDLAAGDGTNDGSLLGPLAQESSYDFYKYDQANDSFATWLFDSPGSQNVGYDFSNMLFLDFGMDFADRASSFDGSMPQSDWPYVETTRTASIAGLLNSDTEAHAYISDARRQSIVTQLSCFTTKRRWSVESLVEPYSVLQGADTNEWSNLTAAVLQSFVSSFWEDIAPQVSVVHRPTFCASTCEPLLLLALVTLGIAAQMRTLPKGSREDYRDFADFVATNLRWKVFTHDDAQPPVHLWVAQALVLLELYEKIFSTRRLHERSHIHHASTLTLLRRGNPMTGRSGSETPLDDGARNSEDQTNGHKQLKRSPSRSWWQRWVANESMNRVVFFAFEMDSLHACLFGHSAEILPQELRLPLPCDDSLWSARSAEEVQRLENTLAMYGIKSLDFLDGLKRSLHGSDVQTHHLGRLILMAGLLSVSWHIDSREKHLQFVETAPSVAEQARWKSLSMHAFHCWRENFNAALDQQRNTTSSLQPAKDPRDPDTLYYAANITRNIDIIDAQLLSGTKRLLGRKVSEKDRALVQQRMMAWTSSGAARRAASQAYKLLHANLWTSGPVNQTQPRYSCRADTFIHRPWMLYLAGLTIWAYQYCFDKLISGRPEWPPDSGYDAYRYVSACSAADVERLPFCISAAGCCTTLQLLYEDFEDAESEILLEASKRLQDCVSMLEGQ